MAFANGGRIVTNGLVLSLDASDQNSYPGSGTTWSDLSGNNNSGTLVASPTFSSTNSGNLVFNGSSQYINCGNNSSVQITVGTISAWVRATSPGASFRSIMAKQFAWGLFIADNILVAYDWGNSLTRTTSLNIANGIWNHTAMSFTQTVGTPSNNAIIYLNGAAVLTATIKHLNQSANLQIAGATTDSTQILNGNIANAQVYNRVLSAAEIAQNYDAQKSRFNLT
jgi:hypothetical protein